jgi:ubiquinone/menaquinone biosynthesis C-methylase UbiE
MDAGRCGGQTRRLEHHHQSVQTPRVSNATDSGLYVASNLAAVTIVTVPGLAATTERHAIPISLGPLATCLQPLSELASHPELLGVIVAMERGWPGSSHLKFAASALRQKRRVWFYFPSEQAIECIDSHALASYWRLWAFCTVDLVRRRLRGVIRQQPSDAGAVIVEKCTVELRRLYGEANPIPLRGNDDFGVLLRADYWVQLTAGESYDRTCAVAKVLAAKSRELVFLASSSYQRLDQSGIAQVVMPAASDTANEIALLDATWHYYPILKVAFDLRRPAYIYEQLTPGNFAGARVSRDLAIPYIVEYNGSDLLATRTFNGMSLEHELLFARAEEAAFRQATVVVVPSTTIKDALIARKVDAEKIFVRESASAGTYVEQLWNVASRLAPAALESRPGRVATGDAYKEQVQDQWNYNPVGSHYATATKAHTLEWFQEVESHRYGVYAPWMPEVMEFDRHAGHDVLEIGAGMGTDLAQFAKHGARVTDIDLSAGHLVLAQENFERRGLKGNFVHHDAETLPFPDASFDVVYSNGVLHHTPNTRSVVAEIRRVLKPGGKAIVMMYAEQSIHYWRELVKKLGLDHDLLKSHSMGEIMSRYVEISQNDARPLVKVYTAARLKSLFEGFADRNVYKRQLMPSEVPAAMRWLRLDLNARLMGWNVIIKARKPRS